MLRMIGRVCGGNGRVGVGHAEGEPRDERTEQIDSPNDEPYNHNQPKYIPTGAAGELRRSGEGSNDTAVFGNDDGNDHGPHAKEHQAGHEQEECSDADAKGHEDPRAENGQPARQSDAEAVSHACLFPLAIGDRRPCDATDYQSVQYRRHQEAGGKLQKNGKIEAGPKKLPGVLTEISAE